MIKLDDIKAAILGHAIGDALGVPAEFNSRSYLEKNPITDMIGYGTHHKPAGTWSDDTSMTLATLDSLASRGLDYADLMERFIRWWKLAEYTATDEVFDIGNTTRKSLMAYDIYHIPAEDCGQSKSIDNGNGSLMRIIPIILYLNSTSCDILDTEEKLDIVHKASALTHAHEYSKTSCGIYYFILTELISNKSMNSIKVGIEKAKIFYKNNVDTHPFKRIFNGNIEKLYASDIMSHGYVVSTLEAALWCVMNTDNYKDCILKAVNLGEDTDTVAAIAGGLAGVLYGVESIPASWLNKIIRRDVIENLCEKAYAIW